ncbi:MAG: TM0106 family RecB-like putative nuclease, partial [Actinomycetia bacterium]|nr:TM0106 family RecB-like putative nuclease [Actinomycetes bacterium]
LEQADDVTLLSSVTVAHRDLLKREGITRIDQIAAMDPSDERLPGPSVVLQARARTAGGLLRFNGDAAALNVPTSRTEVDFDIETYDGRIYLAGFLVSSNGTSIYEPIIDWSGEPSGERRLVEEMFARLAELADDGALVQHWTDYERRTLSSAGARHGLSIPGFASVDAWFDDHAVDLCAWTRQNLVSPNGYSLKVIAPLCGFEWRDDDPGGRQSEIWFERLVAGDSTMRNRLLEYNEDDVVAQREIRHWVRRNDSGAGPGSAIPSVQSWPPATVDR